jgi:DNA gyrase/topoisomerase IV subunit A
VAKKRSWQLLVVTEDGYGKRTHLRLIPRQRRGGYGVRIVKKGKLLAGAEVVVAEDEIVAAEPVTGAHTGAQTG